MLIVSNRRVFPLGSFLSGRPWGFLLAICADLRAADLTLWKVGVQYYDCSCFVLAREVKCHLQHAIVRRNDNVPRLTQQSTTMPSSPQP